MGFNDNFYNLKKAALNIKDSDTLIIGRKQKEFMSDVKSVTGNTGEYDFATYPIKNTVLQLQNKQGESLLGSFYYTSVPKKDVKK